jgi:hypothetical protein
VLHDAADDDVALLVTQRVNIQLHSPVQVLVDKHGLVGINLHRCVDVAACMAAAERVSSATTEQKRGQQMVANLHCCVDAAACIP